MSDKILTMHEDEFFRHIQSAYYRGVDFASELFAVDDFEYSKLWHENVPKAAYDYADKTVSSISEPHQEHRKANDA